MVSDRQKRFDYVRCSFYNFLVNKFMDLIQLIK